MSGKISDLGVAKILNLTPAQMTQRMSTQAPGTPCYMPPEAVMARPTYTSKIDSYSYGVMVIHVLCGRWPFPADAFRPDPQNPDMLVPVLELDRRAEYLQDIDQDHPLMGLISQCLSNAPTRRPEASEILRQITATASRVPERHQNQIEMLQHWEGQIESLTARNQDKQSQIESLTAQNQDKQSQIEALTARNQTLQSQNEALTAQNQEKQSQIEALRAEVRYQKARLHWRKVANLPVGKNVPQVVVVGEKVYVGSGSTVSAEQFLVFQYNPARDEWTTLPPCPVIFYGLGQLSGELLTVGGLLQVSTIGYSTKKVYHYKPESQEWEEFLQPMPTARQQPTVISTQSVLVACGGATDMIGRKLVPCTTVEVYTTETSQWHTADPLPVPCMMMSSAIINNTAYLLGGLTTDHQPITTVPYAPVASLIQRATSHPQQSASAARPDSTSSAWKTLNRATPVVMPAAASLAGLLLTVGGTNDKGKTPAVHFYSISKWIRVLSWDMPEPRAGCAAAVLAGNRLLVVGGKDQDGKSLNTVFLGSLIV